MLVADGAGSIMAAVWVSNTSETYLQFLMLHACFVSTLLCFVYTLRCFYIFSGTNLLKSCQSVSCLFSSIFGSRKVEHQYYRNWTGQRPKSITFREGHESRRRDGEAPEGGQTPLGTAKPGLCLGRVLALCPPPRTPPSPIRILRPKNPK